MTATGFTPLQNEDSMQNTLNTTERTTEHVHYTQAQLPPTSRWHRYLRQLDPHNWQTLMGWPLLLTYFILTFAQVRSAKSATRTLAHGVFRLLLIVRVIAACFIVQELPTTAVGLLLVNGLHFGPDETPQYYAATFIPWTIRPVYAFISDQLPLFSYRRRPYFILSAVLACGLQVCLALFGQTKHTFFLLGVAVQVFIAVGEVACDSLTVEWGNLLAQRLIRYQIKKATVGAAQIIEQQEHHSVFSDGSQQRRSRVNTQAEWSTPLLVAGQEKDEGGFFRPKPTQIDVQPQDSRGSPSDSPTASSPLSSSPTSSSSIGRGYASLEQDEGERCTNVLPLRPAYTATPAPSPNASVESSPSPYLARVAGSVNNAAEAMAERVFEHILRTTDAETLTPLVIKSRIQSECMSIRSTGSVFAAGASIVMLLYLSPRTVILWSSVMFLLGIAAIVFYVQEVKIKPGFFYLSDASSSDLARKRIEVMGVTLVPNAEDLFAKTEPVQNEEEQKQQHDPEAINTSIPLQPLVIHAHGGKSVSETSVPISSDLHEESHTQEGLSDPHPKWLCGIPLSRWLFLYRKLLALMNALVLLAKPLFFIFLFNLMPTSEDAFENYLYSSYSQFVDWQFGLFNFVGLGGSLIGCLFYQQVLAPSKLSLKKIFIGTSVAASAIGCLQIFLATHSNSDIGIGDQAFVILSSILVSGFGILAQLPPIILASHYSPKGFGLEASMFSLFAAAAHIGSLASAECSSSLTKHLGITENKVTHVVDFTHLWKLILICNCLSLAPLITMPYLLKEQPVNETEEILKEEEEQTHTTSSRDEANMLVPASSAN